MNDIWILPFVVGAIYMLASAFFYKSDNKK